MANHAVPVQTVSLVISIKQCTELLSVVGLPHCQACLEASARRCPTGLFITVLYQTVYNGLILSVLGGPHTVYGVVCLCRCTELLSFGVRRRLSLSVSAPVSVRSVPAPGKA